MKRLFIAALVALTAGCATVSTETSTQKETIAANENPERRGCCSHHKGVCGCSGGRAMCCDGTLSPTCGCD